MRPCQPGQRPGEAVLPLGERSRVLFPCSAQAPPWAPSSTIPKGRNSSPGAAAAPVQQLGFGELHRQELMAELVQIQGINIKVWNFSGNHPEP